MEPHKPAKAGGGLGDRRKKKKKGNEGEKNIYMEKKKIVKVECLQFKIDKEGKCQHNESGSTEGSENKNKNKHYKAQLKRGTETQPERSIGNILK